MSFTISVPTRANPQHGGEPFGGGGSEDMLALLQASEVVASAQFAPINQMEWEANIDWGEQETSSRQPASLLSPEGHETGSIAGAKQAHALLSTRSSHAALHHRGGTVDVVCVLRLFHDMHAELCWAYCSLPALL